jgi:hypothetical protein
MVIVYTYTISRKMNFIKEVGCGGGGLEDLLMEEEIGVVLTQTILTFPCGFIFGVVAPLNFHKLHHTSLHLPFIIIKNGNGMLLVGEARLKIKCFEVDDIGRNMETPLQLRDMEHIVNGGK